MTEHDYTKYNINIQKLIKKWSTYVDIGSV